MKKSPINPVLKFRFSLNHRIVFYKKLMSFTKEEFPVFDSLVKFKERFDKKKDFRAKIIEHILNTMKHGYSFSYALKGWVPEAELNLISAGEEGKGIDTGLAEAIKFGDSAKKIKSTIVAGSIYPLVLLSVVLGFIAMFSVQMAPTYLNILPLQRWPSLGQSLYGFSTFIVNYMIILLLILAALGVFIGKTMGGWTGPIRRIFDKLPPWSIYKVYQASSFLISLASMMQSGTPLNDALKKIKNSGSPWLAGYLEEMLKNMKKGGKNFGQHLHVGLLDEETAGDVIDYSELGKFEEAIYSIGEQNLEESVKKISQKMGLARNLMIVIMGLTVGIIYYTSIELNSAVAEAASSNTKMFKK